MNTAIRHLEDERFAETELWRVLNSAPPKDFENSASLAAQICAAPIALIGFLNQQQLCLKAAVGLAPNELSWPNPIWSVALSEPDFFMIPDIQADKRFGDNPLLVIGDLDVRFLAAIQLIADDGSALGTLIVMDQFPRQLTLEQQAALRVIARQAVGHCELLRAQHRLTAAMAEKRQYEVNPQESRELESKLIEWSPDCINILDLGARILRMNFGGLQALEICDPEQLDRSSWIDLWPAEYQQQARLAVSAACSNDIGRFTGLCATESGTPKWWDVVVSPIHDSAGNPDRLLAVMRDVMQRRRVMQTLRAVTEATAGVTGEEFFRALVRHLAQALQLRYAFIAECADDRKTQVRTLAFWNGAEFADNVGFPLSGTPCEKVVGGKDCYYPERLQNLFPEDAGLVKLNAQSYLGAPVLNSNGEILGHVVVMDDKPRDELDQYLPLLHTFGARAGAELERKRVDDALRQSETRRRALLDINNAIVTKLASDELWSTIAHALGLVLPFDRIALALYDTEAGALRIVTHAGSYERMDYTPVGRMLDLRDSAAGEAFTQRRVIIRRNLEHEQPTASDKRAYAHGFQSLCSLPLVVRGDCIGTITLGSLVKNSYVEEDAAFLLEIANQIAIAVDNMRIHEEAEALKARFQAETVYLQEEIRTEHNFQEIIGQSAPVRVLLRKLEQVAPTDATVLIRGETGTGKELLARAVHDRSRRKDRPLVKVNCGSIPSGLVESELFGHEKGAFTGATQRRVGRFELAHGGTIFLDEVTELPLDTQVKLLRVLQEGEFERVGSSQTMKVDVRVIAATNRDLSEIVAKGTFRSDLFYRLNVFPLESPALRERRADIPLLVSFFLSRFGKKLGKEVRGVAQKSMDSLIHYSWPGNVRELQNVIERAVILAHGPVVQVDESMLRSGVDSAESSAIETLESHERNHIVRALNETKWVIHGKKGAAEILGINPSTLRSRMEKLGIKKTEAH